MGAALDPLLKVLILEHFEQREHYSRELASDAIFDRLAHDRQATHTVDFEHVARVHRTLEPSYKHSETVLIEA